MVSVLDSASPIGARAPALVTALIIAVLWAWHIQFIGIGGVSRFDEFYTWERSVSFARHEDWWAVFTANKPTIKKPPMQYWMTAGFFELGLRDVVALRLPSMLFALLVLGATAVLTRIIVPQQPWAMVGAVLLISASGAFWDYATSAMLEVGSTLFVTIGVIAMIKAFEDPRYWALFALAVFLGGMQKAPNAMALLPFALISLALTRRIQPIRVREIIRERQFKIWVLAAAVLGLLWPLYMGLRFPGEENLQGSVEKEMLQRFAPSLTAIAAYGFDDFQEMILGDKPWLRGLGILSLIALPFVIKRPILLSMTGVVLFVVVIFSAGTDTVKARYMLSFEPLLAASLACLVMTVMRQQAVGLAACAALSVLIGGPLKEASDLALNGRLKFGLPYEDMMGPVRDALQPGEALIFCHFDDDTGFPRAAYTVHGADERPYVRLRQTDVWEALKDIQYEGGPARGLCTPKHMDRIKEHFVGLQSAPLPAGYIHFWADDVIALPK